MISLNGKQIKKTKISNHEYIVIYIYEEDFRIGFIEKKFNLCKFIKLLHFLDGVCLN